MAGRNKSNSRNARAHAREEAEVVSEGRKSGNSLRITDEAIADLLTKCGGFVSRVAKTLGCAPSTIYRRIDKSEMLQSTMADISDTVLDIAESSLIKAAGAGEPWAVCFVLKCKGKKRGWIEKHDISVEHKDALPPVVLGVIPLEAKTKEGE